MRRNGLFWGTFLVLAGILLMLSNFGLLPSNMMGILWAVFLILLGVWFLLGPMLFRYSPQEEVVSIPLNDALEAKIKLRHGAGKITLKGLSQPGILLSGTTVGGVEQEIEKQGALLKAKLRVPSDFWMGFPPMGSHQGSEWNLTANTDIPLILSVKSGASETFLDLTDLLVKELELEGGASSNEILMPARSGATRAKIQTGAASVVIRFPQDVAARIRVTSGLAGIQVDTTRFPKLGEFYQSPNFDTAINRVELSIETGVGSVDIR